MLRNCVAVSFMDKCKAAGAGVCGRMLASHFVNQRTQQLTKGTVLAAALLQAPTGSTEDVWQQLLDVCQPSAHG